MRRLERTRILIEGTPTLRRELADRVRAAHEIFEIASPSQGLVMMKVRESARRSLFYMGEVLVTEAKVSIGESIGLGILRGDDAEAALDLAVIDAAYAAGLQLCEDFEPALLEEARRIAEAREAKTRAIDRTRVDFQTMDTDPAV